METIDLDYINRLTEILRTRQLKNPKYSKRALARDLDIDPAYLVHIFKGNKRVTPVVAFKIAESLDLKGDEFISFIRPVFH